MGVVPGCTSELWAAREALVRDRTDEGCAGAETAGLDTGEGVTGTVLLHGSSVPRIFSEDLGRGWVCV